MGGQNHFTPQPTRLVKNQTHLHECKYIYKYISSGTYFPLSNHHNIMPYDHGHASFGNNATFCTACYLGPKRYTHLSRYIVLQFFVIIDSGFYLNFPV